MISTVVKASGSKGKYLRQPQWCAVRALNIMENIPGTDNFKASIDGRIFGPDDLERNYCRNGDGYVTCNIRIKGRWITFGVQRLIAITFLSHERTEERDFVNHIDGDIENNHKDNLEWVTSYENNIHIKILKGCPEKNVLIMKSPNGEFSFAKTQEIACELINCTFPELWYSIKNRTLIDGWEVKYNTGKIPEQLKIGYTDTPFKKTAVDIWNVDTDEIVSYDSISDAATAINTTTSLISQVISTFDKPRLCLKKYIIVHKGRPFPNLSKEDIAKLREHKSKSVLVIELKTGKRTIYQTAVNFYRPLGLSKKAVTVALRADKIRELGGYVFLYLNSRNVERLNNYTPLSGESV